MERKKRVVIADIHSKNENGKCTGHFFFFAENYKNVTLVGKMTYGKGTIQKEVKFVILIMNLNI